MGCSDWNISSVVIWMISFLMRPHSTFFKGHLIHEAFSIHQIGLMTGVIYNQAVELTSTAISFREQLALNQISNAIIFSLV